MVKANRLVESIGLHLVGHSAGCGSEEQNVNPVVWCRNSYNGPTQSLKLHSLK